MKNSSAQALSVCLLLATPAISAQTPITNSNPLDAIGLPAAHEITRGSSDITVALLSSSVNCRLPELRNSIRRERDLDRALDACESVEGSTSNDLAHGTYSASVILKVAPGIKILPLRVFGPSGSGSLLDLARAIDLALTLGVDVIAVGGGGSYPPNSDAAHSLICSRVAEARRQNVPVVVPSGSEISSAAPHLLASCKNDTLFAVAGLDATLQDLAKFSSYSSHFVQIAAPSQGVEGLDASGEMTSFRGTTVSYLIGTGLVALRRSLFPNESVLDRRDAVLSAVTPLSKLVGKTESGGRVHAPLFVER